MKAYLNCISKAFSKNLAYRAEVWISIAGNILTILIEISIWRALLGKGSMDGITLEDMITYTIISMGVSIILLTDVFHTVDAKLKSGIIAMDLIKPLRFPIYLASDQLGTTLFHCVFNLLPSVLIASLIIGFQLPPFAYIFPFILALLIAMLISFAIGYFIALVSFWFLTTSAFERILRTFTFVFSGAFVPVWFFPDSWATIAQSLPFQYMGFIPASIYLGKIPLDEAWITLGWGGLWILFLFGSIYLLWWKAMNRLVIHGG